MSQAGIVNTAGGGGGGSPVQTLTGNTGGAVPPTANNINILGSGDIIVTGSPGTNTLTISNSTLDGTTTTVGAVTGNVITIPLGAVAGCYTFDCKVVGFNSASPAGVGYTIVGSVRTDGATATLLVGQAVDSFEEAATSTCTGALVVSANNAIIQVLGATGLTIDWKASTSYLFIG